MIEALVIPQFDETRCEEGATVSDFIDLPGVTEPEFYEALAREYGLQAVPDFTCEKTVTVPVRIFDDFFDADDSHDQTRISEAKYALYCAAYFMCPDCGEHDGNHTEECMPGKVD